MEWNELSAADGFAIAMLGMIFLSFGVIGLLVFCMLRNARMRDPDVDDLLDEVAESEKADQPDKPAPTGGKAPENSQPWERESDWWKQR